jgi:hypothetical protein
MLTSDNFGIAAERTPRELAELVDSMAASVLLSDRESAQILIVARESLRALGWNRYAQRINKRSERMALTRRLRRHAGWRVVR